MAHLFVIWPFYEHSVGTELFTTVTGLSRFFLVILFYQFSYLCNIENVPRGIQGGKSKKDTASSGKSV